jgi:hypothetical protein
VSRPEDIVCFIGELICMCSGSLFAVFIGSLNYSN